MFFCPLHCSLLVVSFLKLKATYFLTSFLISAVNFEKRSTWILCVPILYIKSYILADYWLDSVCSLCRWSRLTLSLPCLVRLHIYIINYTTLLTIIFIHKNPVENFYIDNIHPVRIDRSCIFTIFTKINFTKISFIKVYFIMIYQKSGEAIQ